MQTNTPVKSPVIKKKASSLFEKYLFRSSSKLSEARSAPSQVLDSNFNDLDHRSYNQRHKHRFEYRFDDFHSVGQRLEEFRSIEKRYIKIQPKNSSFDDVPLLLENTFRFLEEVTMNTVALKPFSQMTNEEIITWCSSLNVPKFTELVRFKQYGKWIKYLTYEKLIVKGIPEESSKNIIEVIQHHNNQSKIGKRIIHLKFKTYDGLRKMFCFIEGYSLNKIIPFSCDSMEEACLIAFMVIRNYFAKNGPLISQQNKLNELQTIIRNINNDDNSQIMKIRTFFGSLTPEHAIVLQRTLVFIYKMTTSEHSIFCYHRELFFQTIFGFIFPFSKSDSTNLRHLVDSVPKIFPKSIHPNSCLLESEKLYNGEIIIKVIDNTKLPLHIIMSLSQIQIENSINWMNGKLYLTNYRLIWKYSSDNKELYEYHTQCLFLNQVPLKIISTVEIGNLIVTEDGLNCMKIITEDARILTFGIPNEQQLVLFRELILFVKNDFQSIDRFFYIDDCEQMVFLNVFENIWEKTAERIGVDVTSPDSSFQVEYCNNIKKIGCFNGIVCRCCPFLKSIRKCIDERSPVLIHRAPSGAYLFKLQCIYNKNSGLMKLKPSKQTNSFFEELGINNVMLSTSRFAENAYLLKSCIDMNIYNKEMCQSLENMEDSKIFDHLDSKSAQLLRYEENLLNGAFQVVKEMENGKSILIVSQNSNSSEIGTFTSLILLLSDPFFRSLNGFLELIYKEFIQHGYFTTIIEYKVVPVHFISFLHIVKSIAYMYPKQFGFNSNFLQFLYHHCFTGRFATFEKCPTNSFFIYVQRNSSSFLNSSFVSENFDFATKNDINELSLLPHFQTTHRWINYTGQHSDLFNTSAAVNLNLRNRNITELPTYIKDVSKAKSIDISNNLLIEIPQSIQQATGLEKLSMSSCYLSTIPHEFFKPLINLTFLDISDNSQRLTRNFMIPKLHYQTNLKYLDMSRQIFSEQKLKAFKFPQNIQTLLLNECIHSVPLSLSKLSNINCLELSNNPKLDIDVITTLPNLSDLCISSCEYTTIPCELRHLTNLTRLDISKNLLCELPQWLFQMTSLCSLNLSNNNLKYISSLLPQLSNLTTLDISSNKIYHLPHTTNVLKKTIKLFEPPVINKMHLLSTQEEIPNLKQHFVEWTMFCKKEKIIFLEEEDVLFKDANTNKESDYFEVIFEEDITPLSCNFAPYDCYVLTFTSKTISHVYFWGYYINKILPPTITIFVLLLLDAKVNEKQHIESTIKDVFPKSNFLHLSCGKESEKVLGEKFGNWIHNNFKNKWKLFDHNVLTINRELLNCELNPLIVTEDEALQLIQSFGSSERTSREYLEQLHGIGTIICCTKLIETMEQKIKKYVILRPNVLNRVLDIMNNNSTNGFGFMDDIIGEIKEMGDVTNEFISFIIALLELRGAAFVVRLGWLEKFGLTEKYRMFLQRDLLMVMETFSMSTELQRLRISTLVDKKANTDKTNRKYAKLIEATPRTNVLSELQQPKNDSDHLQVTFFVRTFFSRIPLKQLETIWKQHDDAKYALFGWGFYSHYIPSNFLDSISAVLFFNGYMPVNIFLNCLVLEVEENDEIYPQTISQTMKSIQFIERTNKIIHFAVSKICPNLLLTEEVYCPKCLLTGSRHVRTIFLDTLKTHIKNGSDFISFGLEHRVASDSASLPLMISMLREEFSDLIIDGNKAKIKKRLWNNTECTWYEISYLNDVQMYKIFTSENPYKEFEVCIEKQPFKKMVCHPNILQLKGFSLSPTALLFDYCDRNLQEYVHDKSVNIEWKTVVDFALQIATGMNKLHQLKMVHRNLQTSSIAMRLNQDTRTWTILIADFGKTVMESTGNSLSTYDVAYTSPEIIQQLPYTRASDVYSFGIVLWELATRIKPFEKNKTTQILSNQILNGVRPFPTLKTQSSIFNKLVGKCWHQQQANRPTFSFISNELENIKKEGTKGK
ncbi:Protein kinase domain containing protein [Entamoeba marina]